MLQYLNKSYSDFYFSLKNKSKFEKFIVFSWLLMPLLMMVSKTFTDFIISIIAFSFLFKSTKNLSFSWLKINWIKWSILFILVSLISSCLSLLPLISFQNGLSWIRFPIFALAICFWLSEEKETIKMSLIINFLSLVFIYLLMSIETVFTDHTIYLWPFGNPLNGPFIHKVGIIFFSLSLLLFLANHKLKFIALCFFMLSLLFSILSGYRVGSFSFVIIIFLSILFINPDIKRISILLLLFSLILIIYFTLNPNDFERYFINIINFSDGSFIQYLGQWKTGIYMFIKHPLLGIGPTNVQNYLSHDFIQNFDPYGYSEHPHNHYIQAFAETGIIGGLFYCLMVISIIITLYKKISLKLKNISDFLILSSFISSICLLWPFGNTYDLFGQQQNGFLWYSISFLLVINSTHSHAKITN